MITSPNNSTSFTLHIGLMKTASTFLQHNIFPKYPGVLYLEGKKSIFNRTMIRGNGPVFISNEDISGCPYLTDIEGLGYFEQFKRSLKNIKTIFKDPKIVVCFREPSKMINSFYKQYLQEGGTVTWEEFFSLNGEGVVKKEDFLFTEYLSVLKDQISKENLFVYTFDDFKKNPEKVAKNIYGFISGSELPENVHFNTDKRSNPSVKDDLENLLIKLNRLDHTCKEKWGFRLKVSLFGKMLNPRVFCQYLLPKFYSFQNRRDLANIKAYYESDWNSVVQQINNLNNIG